MSRINFRGQNYEVPARVNGADLRQILGLSQGELPVKVRNNGDYESVDERNEYFIEDGSEFEKVNNLGNGEE